MKIGILTHFHKNINYGGVLQGYALCKHLNSQGHTASQILYEHKVDRIMSSSFTLKELFIKIINRIDKKIYRKRNLKIKSSIENCFSDFRDSVPHTQKVYTRADIGHIEKEFDVFVTGSDQVWNPIWHDPTYFLDFAGSDITKISYAASIGVGSLDEEQRKIFKKYLSAFQSISVRERIAAAVLEPLVDKVVNVSVDPTLLLSVDDWDEIATERKIEERYVFLYALGDDIKIRKLAEKFAKAKGLKLVMIPDLMGKYRRKDRKIKAQKITDATPCDFISLIKYADYIFTDSFHACVFSLLYKRNFFAFQRLGSIEMSSRIHNIMEMFECCERFCVDKKQMSVEHLLTIGNIDYSKNFELFTYEKRKSMDYLKANLI